MSRWDRRTWAATLAGAAVIAAGALLPFVGALPTNVAVTPLTQAIGAIRDLLWLANAAVLLARRPPHRLGWLALGIVAADWIWTLGYTGIPALYFLASAFAPLSTALFAHVVLAFPSGRLPTAFDRRVVAASYAVVAVSAAANLFLWEPGYEAFRNPFAIWPSDSARDAIGLAAAVLVPVLGVGLLVGLARHWRAATPAARRALRPILVAAPIFVLVGTAGYLADNLSIDVVSAAVRTAPFIATGLIVPLGYLVGVARARLARARVSELATELGRGVPLGSLRDVLARAMGDPGLQLAFGAPDGSGFVDTAGRSVALEPALAPGTETRVATRLEVDGRLIAVILHDPGIDEQDPGLIEAVGSLARLALENERLAAEVRAQLEEVRASRARIVEAADGERRKVERNLHDGAQQRLVALMMRLEQARTSAAGSAALIDDVTRELHAAVEEVRGLARGLQPPILAESGLAAALESLAERTPIPVAIDVGPERFGSTVETTAYFVVSEALANVVKHANATHVTIRARIAGRGDARAARDLVLTIRDDGRGGADATRGTGLRGLLDRVAAAGGALTVTSPAGKGTTVQATLPLE